MPGVDQISAMAQHLQQTVACILAIATVEGDAESHIGLGGRHVQIVKKRHQIRVGRAIVNDKTSVHGNDTFRCQAIDGIGMSAKPVFRLNQRHIMALRQEPGCGQA